MVRIVIALIWVLLGQHSAQASVWSSAPEPVRAVSRWGAAGLATGALTGVVVAPIAQSARPIFLGASVGLYLGVVVGLYNGSLPIPSLEFPKTKGAPRLSSRVPLCTWRSVLNFSYSA